MAVILQVTFPYEGPFGDEMTNGFTELAQSINNEPGFKWKIWTEDAEANVAGGIYMFDSKENAAKYLNMHTERLASFGITGVEGKILNVNDALSKINHFAQ
ncbi:monooxygenase [Macrococcus animalis]|uniref:monooxygenase n=1 Tax=Macrococcus animalis TaxID=3395467 RepID=UPI0039BE9A10